MVESTKRLWALNYANEGLDCSSLWLTVQGFLALIKNDQ